MKAVESMKDDLLKKSSSKEKTGEKYSKSSGETTTLRLIVILLVVLICLVAVAVAILLFGRDTGNSDLSGNNQSDAITATTPIEPITTTSPVATDEVESTTDTTHATTSTDISAETEAPTEPSDPFAEYILPFSSERLLTEEDISHLSQEELEIARNEIFARYGRLFADKELQTYFDAKEWYSGSIAAADFSLAMLSSIERVNVEFIMAYEHPDIDSKTLKAMAYGETTESQLRQQGFELTFESHLKDRLGDIYRIKNTDVLVALGRNADGIVDEPVVVAISAPAELIIPDKIGLPNDAFEENHIIFVPDGKITGDVGTGLFFGFPEKIPNKKITKETMVCFTGTTPPAGAYSFLQKLYLDPSEPEETPNAQLQDWQNAYLDYLEKHGEAYSAYALVYVDADAIPELYMRGSFEAIGDLICSYKQGEVVVQNLRRTHGGRYIEYSGKLMNTNGNMGNYSTEIYTLTNAGFTNIFSGSAEEFYIGDEDKTEVGEEDFAFKYSIGDREVSKEEFDAAIAEVFNLSAAVYFDEYEVSYNKIVQNILNW